MHPDPLRILKEYFKHDSFRPMQEEIIDAVLEGRDSLALLPTSGGKSICFQVAALAKNGLCLVICPLIALMKDQVENLRKKGVTAFAIYSGMGRKEVINRLKIAGESNCKFLYVSPERLETNLFKEFLPSLHISLIAVDEAHCISQWGYDFRPSYLRLAELREELPGVPVLALTASATLDVQKDICDKLHFRNGVIFRQSFERAALSYSVFNTEAKLEKITEILQKVAGVSIVYCKSRRRSKEISIGLNRNGIEADFYHAGLSQEERNHKQESWIKNITRVMVCTNAFGMGIDKPDVRTVIHADPPDCLENYYQEAGRAGRDGKKSFAVLLYNQGELSDLESLPDIHFPNPEQIRLVYKALMNYLQIPSGIGEGNYYDFDFPDFIRKFKLDKQLVIHSLKALEAEELIVVNDQVFLPSRIFFTANKEMVAEFEMNNPGLEPLIKHLLRTYPGIIDQPVTIYEKAVCFSLRKPTAEVISGLQRLHRSGIIQYKEQKDCPQLYFIQNRIKAEDLRINESNYGKRKAQYRQRITAFIDYINNKMSCRSQSIAFYFWDKLAKPCGICDNCLREKNIMLTKEEFDSIHQRMKQTIDKFPVEATELLEQFSGIGMDKAWKVFNSLRADNKLTIDQNRIIQLR